MEKSIPYSRRRSPPAPTKRRHTPRRRPAVLTPHSTGSNTADQSRDEDSDPMGTSFLQFCATCDKQIVVPNSLVLYCSDSCRAKDVVQSPSYPIFTADITPPPSRSSNPDLYPTPDIMPQFSPTKYSHQPLFFQQPSSMASDSDSQSVDSNDNETRPANRRSNSEAARWLEQFHSTHPRHNRASITATACSTPSLSYTASSSTSASFAHTSVQRTSRPLPRRTNPIGSSTSLASRSIDLVTPIEHYPMHFPTAPSSLETITQRDTTDDISWGGPKLKTGRPEKETSNYYNDAELLSYERKAMLQASPMAGQGSLKKMFRYEEMKVSPRVDSSKVPVIWQIKRQDRTAARASSSVRV